jgi:hypothetical protein
MTLITRMVRVPGGELEVAESGSGEPAIFVQTALTADELRPRANELPNDYRTILYHRRVYAGSSAVTGPGSIARDAADCKALLAAPRPGPSNESGELTGLRGWIGLGWFGRTRISAR